MVTTQTISVRDELFQVDVSEQGTGAPLVYLHNMAMQEPWYPFLDALAQNYRVIAPRFPGFGGSTGIELLDDPLDATIFYNDFLDAIGLDHAHIVGHELGGMFAAELAAVTPHRVDKLVLVAPYGLWLDDCPAPDRFSTPSNELRPMLWANPDADIAKSYSSIDRTSPDTITESTIVRARALSAGGRYLWPFPDRGLAKRIHRIAAPTLLLWGESDGLIPLQYAKAFEAAISKSKLVTIPNAAHMVPLEQPDAFAGAIHAFLSD